jgi:hypothetical protein
MPRASLLIAIVLMIAVPSHGDVLVEGSPPLTQDIVDHTCNFLEWGLDLQFTAAQRDEARTVITRLWKDNDRKAIDGIQQILAAYAQLARATPAARQAAQHKVQDQLVAGMRSDHADATSRWLLTVYDHAHVALADGPPPLTHQIADAYAELLGFLVGEATRGQAIVPERKAEDELAAKLASGWAGLDAKQRQQLAIMPAYWAALRVEWDRTAPADRGKYRAQWAKAFAAAQPKTNQPRPNQPGTAQATATSALAYQAQLAALMMQYQTMSKMISSATDAMTIAMNPGVHYEYRWVP